VVVVDEKGFSCYMDQYLVSTQNFDSDCFSNLEDNYYSWRTHLVFPHWSCNGSLLQMDYFEKDNDHLDYLLHKNHTSWIEYGFVKNAQLVIVTTT